MKFTLIITKIHSVVQIIWLSDIQTNKVQTATSFLNCSSDEQARSGHRIQSSPLCDKNRQQPAHIFIPGVLIHSRTFFLGQGGEAMACFYPWLISSQALHRDHRFVLVFYKWGSGHSAHMEPWGLLSWTQSNKSSLSDAEDSHDSQKEKYRKIQKAWKLKQGCWCWNQQVRYIHGWDEMQNKHTVKRVHQTTKHHALESPLCHFFRWKLKWNFFF